MELVMVRSSFLGGCRFIRLIRLGGLQLSLHVGKIKFDTHLAPDGKNRL